MPKKPRTIRAVIREFATELAQAGIEDADTDARRLVLAAAGIDSLDLIRDRDRTLGKAEEAALALYRRRRLAREPVARIFGRRAFWSLDLDVTPDVLDPRPDTETLVEAALEFLRRAGLDRQPLRILDLGTGSGAILIALLRELKVAFGVGLDRSAAALEVARRNAAKHGVACRSGWVQGNWCDAVAGRIDLIVSNPPYLATAEIGVAEPEVARYDPPASLDGGPDGLNAYRAIVASWQRLGQPPIFLEVGATQATQVSDLLRELTKSGSPPTVRVTSDLAGKERVVAALPQIRFP